MSNRHEVTGLRIDLHGRHSFRDLAASFCRAATAGLGAALVSILDALHESRRRQSAREIARHRHLIDAINARADKWAGERN